MINNCTWIGSKESVESVLGYWMGFYGVLFWNEKNSQIYHLKLKIK